MFKKKSIDEWAFDYWLLQQYAKLCFRLYYKKIEMVNRHNIPGNQPIILAPNHQNALMDAMTFVCNLPYQIVFLARADIFKGKRMIKFLHYLNIMPIYRIRDGIENVKKNDEVFDKTVQVLHNSFNPLVLFAEGNHGDKRRLRPLVKGLFRIALQAQEKYGNNPGVKIIPVGIDYGHYQNFRTTLFVNIGKPIEISAFFSEYTGNSVAALNNLKDTYAEELSKLMIDIQTEDYYELFMYLREFFNNDMRLILDIKGNSLADRFKADKLLVDLLNKELLQKPENISRINEMVTAYRTGLHKFKLRDWVVRKGNFNMSSLILTSILKLIFLPIFIFGWLNNYIPHKFIISRIKNIKDTQFQSSFKYVLGMVIFPIWYLIITGILALLSLPFWFIAFYILLLPVSGLLAFRYYIGATKLIAKIRFRLKIKSPGIAGLTDDRQKISDLMHEIIQRNYQHDEYSG